MAFASLADGWPGPGEIGSLLFESRDRVGADDVLERLSVLGTSAQLFGIRATGNGEDGERVLLRALVGRRAA